ncbi:unnamed protein product [Linum tenue]|uniref:Cytochrome P450 n=1 Tax=Linum tenue TaxID=586396 RepID=A0AAV0GTB5_9ROSI|nr:unnamed protein product [Linum tenue]
MDSSSQVLHLLCSFLLITIIFLILKPLKKAKPSKSKQQQQPPLLPPGPRKLPIIGNLHQLSSSKLLPHRRLLELANLYGPLMHLQLGQLQTIVVSSAEMAKQVMKTHDLTFSSRPFNLAISTIFHNLDLVLAPYGEYWRQLKKLCVLELLSAKRVASFLPIREQEVARLIADICGKQGTATNVSRMIHSLTYRTISRSAFGKLYADDLVDVMLKLQENADLGFTLTTNSVKAILLDMFVAGSETSSTLLEWTMSELIREERVMKKAQAEVRAVFGKRGKVEETGIHELNYLKMVIKPLLVPRESLNQCEMEGFQIPEKTQVIVNAWAIGRDPKCWSEPERFYPESLDTQKKSQYDDQLYEI